MNFLFISPSFPPSFYQFCKELKRCGATVLSIGDAPYNEFRKELKESITEYRCIDMTDYAVIRKTVEEFINKYGRIDRVDSHNEYWLPIEAKLRKDFDIYGQKPEDLAINRSKLEMKKVFEKSGVPAVEARAVTSPEILYEFVEKYGYPVIIKPDTGVGAGNTFKIKTREQLDKFIEEDFDSDYIVEPFVVGKIVTFDGFTDRNGDIIFFGSFELSLDVLSALQKQRDSYYYYSKEIDERLVELGYSMVKGFGVKERFFHCEFFRTESGDYSAIEINVRPPGGYAIDMLNYSCDIDLYRAWAELVVNNKNTFSYERKYYVATVLRRDSIKYAHSTEEIMKNPETGALVYKRLPEIFAAAMGNDTFILRNEKLQPLLKAIDFALEKV